MTEPLGQWIAWAKYRYPNIEERGYGHYRSDQFLRDPTRAIQHNQDVFLSPADGVVLYQKVVNADDELGLNIKGKPYSIKQILEDSRASGQFLVTGIFMTVYDVHINRVPYSGILSYKTCPPVLSANKPMDLEEDDIMAKHLRQLPQDRSGYLKYNARIVNRVYIPEMAYSYYMVQIADDDIDVIAPFNPDQNIYTHQGNRFSEVRYGSQVDLIMPLDDRYVFVPLSNGICHVRAGYDHLVKVFGHRPQSLYISRQLINYKDLQVWAKSQGFHMTLPYPDLHVTQLYSKEPFILKGRLHIGATGEGRSVEKFGDAIVLRFFSSELSDRNNKLINMGASTDFPDYKSHITISYHDTGLDLSVIEPYAGELIFGPERLEEIVTGFDHNNVVEELL